MTKGDAIIEATRHRRRASSMFTAPLTPASLAAAESAREADPGDPEELARGAALGEDEVLVVTTENRQSIGGRIFLALFLNAFSVGFTVYDFFHPAPDPTFVYACADRLLAVRTAPARLGPELVHALARPLGEHPGGWTTPIRDRLPAALLGVRAEYGPHPCDGR
jgi:hypothetical protein